MPLRRVPGSRRDDRPVEELACKAHIFTACKQAWLTLPDHVAHWPEAAPANEFSLR